MKRHRQTLRWTYAYAYFAFGPPTPHVPKMTQSSCELFQFLQTEAANALEKLSGKLERELQVRLLYSSALRCACYAMLRCVQFCVSSAFRHRNGLHWRQVSASQSIGSRAPVFTWKPNKYHF